MNAVVCTAFVAFLSCHSICGTLRLPEEMAKKHNCRFVDNETPYERVPQGHPTIVDYFYHEEVRGTSNSGIRNKG